MGMARLCQDVAQSKHSQVYPSVPCKVELQRILYQAVSVYRCSECRSEQQIGSQKGVRPTAPYCRCSRTVPVMQSIANPRPKEEND